MRGLMQGGAVVPYAWIQADSSVVRTVWSRCADCTTCFHSMVIATSMCAQLWSMAARPIDRCVVVGTPTRADFNASRALARCSACTTLAGRTKVSAWGSAHPIQSQ
eukprot:CAMPEP_0173171556 /NCGR_PEP_ID=MMETSP1141-20130122/1829_1 /TAXON_ID=483371 /ORGANISM="non described non described, Strain CCMP2298" /LENGTH=105 /DNA_ID=CAMNT_0014093515 /DNA_START=237 /DNA_END=554 /DNA_ORIENTATION=-